MITLVVVLVVVGCPAIVLLARAARAALGSSQDETRSVDRYNQALRRLSTLPERAAAGELYGSAPDEVASASRGSRQDRSTFSPPRPAQPGHGGRATLGDTRRYLPPAEPPALSGLAALSSDDRPWLAAEAARVIGLNERVGDRAPAVEANARLTGGTGLVLMVLLFLEGLTIPFIVRLLSGHVLIGLVLVPPLVVKMVSVLWRFSSYYLGDPRYRRAGPPHPLHRVLGPLLMGSTLVLFASGIALWLAGPRDTTMFRIHQLSFFFWFVVVIVHVATHVLRATRLAAADAEDASVRGGADGRLRQRARRRRTLIGASLVLGLVLGIAGRSVSTPWGLGAPTRSGSSLAGATAPGAQRRSARLNVTVTASGSEPTPMPRSAGAEASLSSLGTISTVSAST